METISATPLQELDIERAEYIINTLNRLKIKQQGAYMVKNFKGGKSYWSQVLNKKKAVSVNHWETFIMKYPLNEKDNGRHMVSIPAEEYIKRLERDKEILGESILTSLNTLHLSQNTLTAMLTSTQEEVIQISSRVTDRPVEQVRESVGKASGAVLKLLKKEDKGAGSQHKGE